MRRLASRALAECTMKVVERLLHQSERKQQPRFNPLLRTWQRDADLDLDLNLVLHLNLDIKRLARVLLSDRLKSSRRIDGLTAHRTREC